MLDNNNIPKINQTLCGPLHTLTQKIMENQAALETWFRAQWRDTPAPITTSVDLRNAGFKLAPIDTNLFPAGFNNLNPNFMPLAIQAATTAIETDCTGTANILILPENHTRNFNYFESLATLAEIFSKAGFNARIGSLRSDLNQPESITLPSGKTIIQEPVERKGNRLVLNNFDPCLIILNNDLSDGIPAILQNLEQRIRPSLRLGWSSRLKSSHFQIYEQVTEEFGELIGIDPWLINPLFRNCGEVNFIKRDGEDCLLYNATKLLAEIKIKYQQYGIKQKPYIVVKADAGTYGMGIMMIDDPQQLVNLNRKQRTHMSASKGNQTITKVILQEGVHTFETWGPQHASAEPVVYMLGHNVIGGFYRIHAHKSNSENLNSPGMQFEPIAFNQSCNNPDTANYFYIYGVIARLALVGAARELLNTNKDT